jgi:hypothetical protein
MPRRADQSAPSGPFSAIKEELGIGSSKNVGGGYEVESVCLHCLSMLQGWSARRGISAWPSERHEEQYS